MPRRTAISANQKMALHIHKLQNPILSNKALRHQFERLYNQKITYPPSLEILSSYSDDGSDEDEDMNAETLPWITASKAFGFGKKASLV
ncbi:hypothetical protein ACO22_05296 [Paracoccidioides brasiliensis]|uniref:ARS-binding protein 1 N-terminal domain-containing protein n=1 Tax=Paracoccidioides brasiliensis TaxID=121759 RepID=A0A1D2JAP6_PARBR|nr:hypothetical protein ACO22_05296 [Paracoccidioides brasiliensis]